MEAACSDNSACEDISSESNMPSLNSKEDQQYACNNVKDTVEIEIQDEFNYCSESKEDSFIDEVVGVHLQDFHAQFSEIAATSEEDDLTTSMQISTMESALSVSFDDSVEKCLSKSATFLSSELESSNSFYEEEIMASPTYKLSVSPSASSSLVSAMKGGRAQNGIALGQVLHVKWALDVYDPPTTSSMPLSTKQSNNHHPRLKSKKKDKHKQKNPKGKKKQVRGHT